MIRSSGPPVLWSGTGSWVLCDESCVHHPPPKKERKKVGRWGHHRRWSILLFHQQTKQKRAIQEVGLLLQLFEVQLPQLMMMIAFITIHGGLVPLTMRSNLGIKIWDYLWFAFTSFAFLFRKTRKKYVKGKSSQPKISSRLLAYTYKCVGALTWMSEIWVYFIFNACCSCWRINKHSRIQKKKVFDCFVIRHFRTAATSLKSRTFPRRLRRFPHGPAFYPPESLRTLAGLVACLSRDFRAHDDDCFYYYK